MGRVTKREWYRRVNDAWPEVVPPLSAVEAVRAVKRLYRFAMKRTWQGAVKIATGNRYTWIRRGVLFVNPAKGWKETVHLLSHYCAHQSIPDEPGHGAAHARFELRMIKEVVKRGWLSGSLGQVAVPVVRDRRSEGLERLHTRLARWEAKQRRAATAIRKITRQLRARERAASLDTAPAPEGG